MIRSCSESAFSQRRRRCLPRSQRRCRSKNSCRSSLLCSSCSIISNRLSSSNPCSRQSLYCEIRRSMIARLFCFTSSDHGRNKNGNCPTSLTRLKNIFRLSQNQCSICSASCSVASSRWISHKSSHQPWNADKEPSSSSQTSFMAVFHISPRR